jgi:hypothetical protein
MTRSPDWRELPFAEIWIVDTEYYPGHGMAHGSVKGDPITPLCLAAIELRSGRTVQLWQDELGPFAPIRLDLQALYVSYLLTAEFGFHRASGWASPAVAIDAYVEFRRLTNDARIKSGDRPKGFYSLPGALRWFGADTLDVAHKQEMRDRILAGPPFTAAERETIQRYNLEDAQGLARLFKLLVPHIPSLEHAAFRGGLFQWALAAQERRGVPIDPVSHRDNLDYGEAIKLDLVREIDPDFSCHEIVNGVPHWRDQKFVDFLQREGIPWFWLDSGKPDMRARTFRDMIGAYPKIGPLHELRSTLAQLRNNKLSVGRDGRNRTLLGPCGTKTGRNAPSNSEFIFGPAKCFRFMISPPPGRALIYRDYSQQEVRIAAVLSGDAALTAACEAGDVYLGIATQLGFPAGRPGLRPLFKIVVLGMLYGLEAQSLALLANIGGYEAREILARLRARFHVFERYCRRMEDKAGLDLQLQSRLGWTVETPPGTSRRTIRNWPIQAAGAVIMQVVTVLAERRGIELVAPIHDAFIAEGAVADIGDLSRELDRLMRDASALVLDGYEIPTDAGKAFVTTENEPANGPILPGERYFEDRGLPMWNRINRLIEKRKRAAA